MDYNTTTITTQSTNTSGILGALMAYSIIWLVLVVVAVVALWKIFTKAGEAGWKSIVPIYNTYILLKIIGRPWWWLLLLIIPFVNLVIAVIIALDLAKSFGKSEAFGIIGLFLFSIIGYMILGFGSAQYVGPGGNSKSNNPIQ